MTRKAFVLVLGALSAMNDLVLRLCRHVAWVALVLMVLVILLQVVCRYVLNSALAWPDEAARFLMLWMAGLIAPSAMRGGGFVAIDMVTRMMPPRLGYFLGLLLLLLSALVLVSALPYGWNHTMGFGGNFESSSLKLPLDWLGLETVRVKLRFMYASLLTGVILLLFVNVELVLRSLIGLVWPEETLVKPETVLTAGAD